MNAVDCPFYHYDYVRGRETEACRFLEASPDRGQAWRKSLCRTCPVPEVMQHTRCEHLALEGTVQRVLFVDRVRITFALCAASLEELTNPRRCRACENASGPHPDNQETEGSA